MVAPPQMAAPSHAVQTAVKPKKKVAAASSSDDSIDMDVEPEEPKPRPDAFAEIEEGSPATACRLPPGFATLLCLPSKSGRRSQHSVEIPSPGY